MFSLSPPPSSNKTTSWFLTFTYLSEKTLAGHVYQAGKEAVLRGLKTLGTDLAPPIEAPKKEERIVWASFANNSRSSSAEKEKKSQPLLLLLGYKNGLQVWDLSDPKVMVEVLSLRGRPTMLHAVVLPPRPSRGGDRFATVRPVLAYCEAESSTAVNFMQLETSDDVGDPLNHADPVVGLHCTEQFFIVATETKISIYNSGTMEKLHELDDCCQRSAHGVAVNPVSLGTRWLAYVSSSRLPYGTTAFGGLGAAGAGGGSGLAEQAVRLVQEGGDSVITLAAQGVNILNQNMNGPSQPLPTSIAEQHQRKKKEVPEASEPSGIVKVVDLQPLLLLADGAGAAEEPLPLIAHFQAHDLASPLTSIKFSQDGSLLATADAAGQHIYIFLLIPLPPSPSPSPAEPMSVAKTYLEQQHHSRHTQSSRSHEVGTTAAAAATAAAASVGTATRSRTATSADTLLGDTPALSPRLIYTLQRGFKRGFIREISFSQDSRWVMFTSERGTAHVFPINPRGGAVNGRTHTSPTIRNPSRFFTSSGQSEHPSSMIPKSEQLDRAVLKLKYPAAAEETATYTPTDGSTQAAAVAVPTAEGKIYHHAGRMAACFAEVGEGQAGAAAAIGGRVPLLAITPQGRLIQHQLCPYADNEARDQIVRNAQSKGGAVSSQNIDVASVTNGLLSWVPSAATIIAKKSFEQQPIRAMSVAYDEWPLCRCEDWCSVTRTSHPGNTGSAGLSSAGGFSSGADDGNAAAGSTAAVILGDGRIHGVPGASSSQWLSQVEIKTHQSGHRKLWMGPQFQLSTHEMDAATSTPTEVGGYEGERRPWGGSTTPIWRFNDAINFQLGSGSWPNTPNVTYLSETPSPQEVVSALAEALADEDEDEDEDIATVREDDLFHMELENSGGAE